VRVKRQGVNVRARKGYWALTPEIVSRATGPRTPEVAAPITQALATLAAPTKVARYVRTWVGSEQGSNGKTRVTIVWEPLPASADLRSEPAGRVSVLAATKRETSYSAGVVPTPGLLPNRRARTPPMLRLLRGRSRSTHRRASSSYG
jgi:hypothetical protein